MKKIGKTVSCFTKLLLVFGILFNSLSSLSVVFADETEFSAILDEDNKIKVLYADANNGDEFSIVVNEKYTYSNCTNTNEVTCEQNNATIYPVDNDGKNLLTSTGLIINQAFTLLAAPNFDGTFELSVSINDLTTASQVGETQTIYTEEVSLDSGLSLQVYDANDALIAPTENKYAVDKSNNKIKVVGTILPGGLSPNDTNVNVVTEFELNNYVYGDHTLPIAYTYNKLGEEAIGETSFTITYGAYQDNTDMLNSNSDPTKYVFDGQNADGSLYVTLNDNTTNILNDIYNILETTYGASEGITYTISNADYLEENGGILAQYQPETQTIEEYLSNFVADGTIISITDGNTTVRYKVIVLADINQDNIINQDDVLSLIEKIVNEEEIEKRKADFHQTADPEPVIDVKDVMALDQLVKNNIWYAPINESEVELDATIELVNPETAIKNNEEFQVNYILKNENYDINGLAGIFDYDNTMLTITKITAKNGFKGSNKNGKFIYINVPNDELPTEEESDYIFLTVTFKALKSGLSTITVTNPEYFNGDTYYKIVMLDEENAQMVPTTNVISLDVSIAQSDDNSLSSLVIGGQEIALTKGVYEYTMNVDSYIANVDVKAIVNHINGAKITSQVIPEELVEGENIIKITVAAENGEEQTYTIKVIREKAETNDSYTSSYEYESNTNDQITTQPETDKNKSDEPKQEEKETNNISRIIIIILILLVIAGLIYIIFKDDSDEETKKVNKDINKFKKDDIDSSKNNINHNKSSPNDYHRNKNNNKKGR